MLYTNIILVLEIPKAVGILLTSVLITQRRIKMIVDVGGKVWDMSHTALKACLDLAKKRYKDEKKHVIYCISRGNTAIMKKEEFDSLKNMYDQIKKYMDMGFRVYYNIGRNKS
jgi:predicted oxidoreductase (fatty acid repression mutant protein)